jgi:hypothetical protein
MSLFILDEEESDMGDLAKITSFRSPRYPVLVVGLLLSVLGSPLALAARERTDVIVFKSGDQVTGEIKQLARGLLRVRTDSMGTVDIEWKDIERVTSNYLFEVEVSNGDRYYGSILPSDEKQHLDVTGEAGPVKLGHISVVKITQLESEFWQRWGGSLDAGFSFARANRLTAWNLGFQANYRLPQYLTNVRFDSSFSDQQDAESTTRQTLRFNFNRFFSDRWFVNFPAAFQQNQELGLDLRSTGGAGLGRHLIQSNRSDLSMVAGSIFSRENFPDDPSVSSLEALLVLNLQTFTFDFPKIDVNINFALFPSLTDLGRFRLAFVSELSYEFFRDFYWKVQMFDDYDSDPQSADAETNDFGIATSIGWTF